MKLGLDLSLNESVSASAAVIPLRLAATRCRPLELFVGTNKQIMTRTAHVAAGDITALSIAVGNFMLQNAISTEQGLGGAVTVSASVEYPAGTFTRITWAGATSKSIANAVLEISDLVAVTIPAGATFWIRQFKDGGLVGIHYNAFRNTALGELTTVAPVGLTDQTMGGTIISSGNFTAPPIAIIARTTAKSICIIGDSKSHGFADTAENATTATPGQRGEIAKSIPTSFPFVNLSSGGMRANLWATQAVQRKKLLPYFSHYYVNLGHNDFYVSSASAATVETSIGTILTDVVTANATAQIKLCTQTHKSTSAGGQWVSTADQTASTGNTARIAYNVRVRSGLIANNNNGFIEISDQVETARDSGIWKNDGVTNKLYTGDGVHETPAGYALISASGVVTVPT